MCRPGLPETQNQQLALFLCASIQQEKPIRSCSSQETFIMKRPVSSHGRPQVPGLWGIQLPRESYLPLYCRRGSSRHPVPFFLCAYSFLVGRISLLSFHANRHIFLSQLPATKGPSIGTHLRQSPSLMHLTWGLC